MPVIEDIESAILGQLDKGSCTLDTLALSLPDFTWNQTFAAVDRLSREQKVRITRTKRLGYRVAVALPSHFGPNGE